MSFVHQQNLLMGEHRIKILRNIKIWMFRSSLNIKGRLETNNQGFSFKHHQLEHSQKHLFIYNTSHNKNNT